MALLMAKVDPATIHLVGRQRNDTMLRYLHTISKSFTEVLDARMFHNSTYALIPNMHVGN